MALILNYNKIKKRFIQAEVWRTKMIDDKTVQMPHSSSEHVMTYDSHNIVYDTRLYSLVSSELGCVLSDSLLL